MNLTNAQLNKLFDATAANLKANGFVGMDFNMAVLCIIHKRIKRPLRFQQGVGKTHDEKVEYWASKYRFMNVSSEDELLENAAKDYKIV